MVVVAAAMVEEVALAAVVLLEEAEVVVEHKHKPCRHHRIKFRLIHPTLPFWPWCLDRLVIRFL